VCDKGSKLLISFLFKLIHKNYQAEFGKSNEKVETQDIQVIHLLPPSIACVCESLTQQGVSESNFTVTTRV